MTDDFYSSIAELYDEIFPYKPVQKEFVEHHLKPKGSLGEQCVLDIGCGTGSLALHLSKSYSTIIGLDPDKEMLDLARIKALKFKAEHRDELEDLGTWVFLEKGMLDLENEFAPASFDAVLCFGNTLVHLADQEQIKSFLKQAYRIMKPGAELMMQIINYDRILDNQLDGLPTIENELIKFERRYSYPDQAEVIRFQTTLTIKETPQMIENDIPLLAIRPAWLNSQVEQTGFVNLKEFSNFKGEPFHVDAQPYILTAEKK